MKRYAFSLVELSIVLVILGLLAGGILAGKSLIRASELRAVGSEYQRYTGAVGAFRDKYFAVPGDMSNATSFWGTAGTCPGNSASPSTDATTCDGDGNNQLSAAAANANEIFRAWQHLANAGLVEGRFTGVANSATTNAAAALMGTNVPASKLSGAGWTWYFYLPANTAVSNTTYFDSRNGYGLFLFFGTSTGSNVTYQPVLVPEEAWNIDTKLDDGKPATGRIITRELDGSAAGTGCSDLDASNSASLAASNYSLANTTKTCSFIMQTGYGK